MSIFQIISVPHIPVLSNEVIKFLQPRAGRNYVDCTLGDGGHAEIILSVSSPDGKLLGIDRDRESLARAKNNLLRFKERIYFVHDSYANLSQIVSDKKFSNICGILFDLGLSSYHLEESGAGFSFGAEEPLDMRFDRSENIETAKDILNNWSVDDLNNLFRNFGNESYSHEIAQEIVNFRQKRLILNTTDLIHIVSKIKKNTREKINPATKLFQALRIQVNRELEQLDKVLPQAIDNLEKGGRAIFISYHSLEDKKVKDFFEELSKSNRVGVLTSKPVVPTLIEQKENPRSRSAKLRAVEKI